MGIKDLMTQVDLAIALRDFTHAQQLAVEYCGTIQSLGARITSDEEYKKNASPEEVKYIADCLTAANEFMEYMEEIPGNNITEVG